MPRHPHRQPLNRGFTAAELVIGLATAGVIALVTGLMFKLGILTYTYTVRQGKMLAASRGALMGEGAADGVLTAARAGATVQDLAGSTLTILSTSAVATSYYLSGDNLYQLKAGNTIRQAVDVASMTLTYYNLDASGRIMQSTSAASATFVTASMTMKRPSVQDKTMTFFSGAKLRAHP